MATDTKLQELVINTMTKVQYDALETKDPNEVYAVTDEKISAQDLDTSNVGSAGQVLSKTADGMEWAVVQGGGSGLPEQTGHTGFLQTDGTNATWSDKKAFTDFSAVGVNRLALGENSSVTQTGALAVGPGAYAGNYSTTAIGVGASATIRGGIAIGCNANTAATGAIQLYAGWANSATNSDANTFKVGNNNGNYQLMNADGTIPSERLASAGTTGQVLSKTDTGMQWVDMGGASGDYLPLSGGTMSGDINIGEHALGFAGGIRIFGNGNIGGIFVNGSRYKMSISADLKKITGVSTLNNGADIAIPTTGGTMVVATPPTEEGTYTLKATVTADGTVTTAWVKDA